MKKIIYLVLAVSFIFTACKKEEGCTDQIATNYNGDAEDDDGSCIFGIVGVWTPYEMTVEANVIVTIAGATIQSFDTSYTQTALEAGIEGNIEFTNSGTIITTNEMGALETDNYTTSGNTVTITNSDDGETDVATYTVTKTNLSVTLSDTDIENEMGMTTTSTYDMTINSTRQ
jgi:hypothetical protein